MARTPTVAMSRVYSQRLYGNNSLNGIASTPPLPLGTIWVVRDISFELLAGAGPYGTSVSIIGVGTIFYQALTSSAIYAQWHGRQVLEVGDELQITTNNPTAVLVSGYVLTTP